MNLRRRGCRTLAIAFTGLLLAAGCTPGAGDEGGTDPLAAGGPAEPDTLAAAKAEEAGSLSSALRAACTMPVTGLVINEFLVDPSGVPANTISDNNGEWVELYNPTDAGIDIQGMALRAPDGNSHTIASSIVVPSLGYVVLCRNADSGVNGGVTCAYQYSNFFLTNTGDTLQLCSDATCTTIVDEVVYTGQAPTGSSVELRHPFLDNAALACPATPNVPASWDALNFGLSSALFGSGDKGTPGARNSVFQQIEDPACNDNNVCTWDVCQAGTCTAQAKPGCCLTNTDCTDALPCTEDLCDADTHTCSNDAIPNCCTQSSDCIDANPCNQDYCSMGHCAHSAYNIVPGCCYSAIGDQVAADSQCDDKNVCTLDHCNQDTNLCYQDPPREDCCSVNEDCDDNKPCTYDQCWNNVCANPPVSANCCEDAGDCDDGNPCTDDACAFSSCRHFWNTNECCYDNKWCVDHADDGNVCTDERCVLNAGTGRTECQHPYKANCAVDLPYVQPFDGETSLADIGWKVVDYGTNAQAHWLLDTVNGDLGPDEHVLFTWTPTTQLVKSFVVTPSLNAVKSQQDFYNYYGVTTLQWRMLYKHSQPGAFVTLKVVATTTSDFLNGVVLKSWTTDEDLEYTIHSVELPNEVKFSPTLKVGFLVDTGAGTTFNMDSLEIDDVKIASGKGNQFVKSKVYRCPPLDAFGNQPACNVNTGTLVGQSLAPDPVPSLTMGVNDWYRVYLCMYDPDARSFTWQYFGSPGAFVDGSPMDHPSFINHAPDVGQAYGCETAGFAVASLCGTPGQIPGYFYCAVDVKPQGNEDAAGAYRSALVVKDEFDPSLPLHHPYESQTKFDVNLLLNDGYLVWAPNGRDDPAAVLLQAHIKANGRKAQIVSNLDTVADLSLWDGIVAVLGVYGNTHAISNGEASRLKVYLEGGGRMYLEGGEYFWVQKTDTILHPYFKTTATSDGVAKQDGPLAGANFLYGYDFDYGQGATVNAWNDRLTHTPEAGGREVLRNAGSRTFASMVAYEGLSGAGNLYRTVGSSILYLGLAPQSGGRLVDEALGRILDFLENGYPACTQVEQCEDYEVCTDDACSSGQCVNALRPGCIACVDDAVRPDGSAACPIDQACKVDLGYCIDIPMEDRFDFAAGTCGKFFGSGPTSAFCTVDVTRPAAIDSIDVKVKANHLYRGQIKLSLRSPTNDTVVLKNGNPADAARNTYFTYDEGVPSAEPMTAFNGTHLEGTWTLIAEDLDPAIYNGLLEGFHLYATHSPLPCVDPVTDCPPDPCALNVQCVDLDGNGTTECSYTALDCDDGKDCTIDYCDPSQSICVNEPITGSGCGCETHDQCPKHEACLNLAETATCDLVGDRDPVSGEMQCACSPVEGTPFEPTTGLPVAIPDNDASGVTVTLPVTAANYVNHLKVRIKTNHTAVGDLRAVLCHEGTCVTLRNLRGGAVAGFHDVYDFDAVDGPGAIDDFRKLAVAGDWTLTVSDHIASDSGTLTGLIVYVMPADCFTNTDCDDGNPCTADACQNPSTGGTCEHVTKSCVPSDDPCVANQCNPASGECEPANQPDGTPCEDGLYCTEDDSCMAGACAAGGARDCTYLDGTCVLGSCNEDLKQCARIQAPDGSACEDGEACTGGDSCLDGGCAPGSQMLCACPSGNNADCLDDGNLCNGHLWICNAQRVCELTDGPVVCPDLGIECTLNVCDSFDGICKNQMALNFMPCEDGAYCSVADYCETGSCVAGVARDCSGIDEDCKTGVCEEASNACVAQNKANGTTCERDGAGCTLDQCTDGACTFDQNADCSVVDDDCNDGVCQNVGWGSYICVKGPLPDGTVCTDEPNPCTSDLCLTGICEHTTLQNCNGPCGGEHPFDAGDDDCGLEDSCQGGIAGYPNGACVPTCNLPNCIRDASPLLDIPIDERLGCTVAALDVSTSYTFVESVEAKVRLTHSYLGDLTIDIVDPQGYNHRVWNHIGAANEGFANTFDLSFPVPYPGIPTSGVPMCSLQGEQASGTWYVKVCDTGDGNGGVLHDWKLYVRGSMDPNLNQGHRCSDAIDLGSHPVVPTINVDGTTQCSLNSVSDTGCGGNLGPDRLYKFTLTAPRRVTIRLFQPDRDLIMFVKGEAGGTCAAGALECAQLAGAGSTPEILDRQMQPGVYYLGIDTAGGPYDYGSFRFEIRIKDLLPDGADCVGDLGPQDLDCLSQHCQNGFCCQTGDCCPGSAWAVPPDGTDPYPIRDDAEWISADGVCPAQYKEPAYCDPAVSGINICQGARHDANCVDHMCVKTRVDDDAACDESVQADACGLWVSVFCGDEGPYVPGAQVKPTCATFCSGNPDCDPEAHCDPVVATDPDQTVAPFTMTCQLDRVNGSTCNENTDCLSNHCQNGFCCNSGDCCPTADVPGALACPSVWTVPPACDDTTSCEGHRYDPVCSNNECGKVLVRDDCACSGLLSDNCGFFIPVYCALPASGTCPASAVGGDEFVAGDPACLTDCLTGGVEDDTKCDDMARCDACTQERVDDNECSLADLGTAVCQGNMPNGYPCDEASDCANKLYLPPAGPDGGHCQNGFCCDFGDCCNQNTDCPIPTPPTGYWAPPVCDDITTCQGHRRDATCPTSTYSCGTQNVPDDTACINDPLQPSDDCGYYKPIFCNGNIDQIDPPCPTTCLVESVESDLACDDDAHCDPDVNLPNQINSICLPDLNNDEYCNEATDCISSHCQVHFCCDAGGCCAGCRVSAAELTNAMGGSDSVANDNGTSIVLNGRSVNLDLSYGQASPVEDQANNPNPTDRRRVDQGFLYSVSGTPPLPNMPQDQLGTAQYGYCFDGVRNVNETDQDCGGDSCRKCYGDAECGSNSDCLSGSCAVVGVTSRCAKQAAGTRCTENQNCTSNLCNINDSTPGPMFRSLWIGYCQ